MSDFDHAFALSSYETPLPDSWHDYSSRPSPTDSKPEGPSKRIPALAFIIASGVCLFLWALLPPISRMIFSVF